MDDSVHFVSGFGEELEEAEDPWEVLDGEEGLFEQAAERYSQELPTEDEIRFEKVYGGVDDFHIYELETPSMDESLVLKVKPLGKGFSVSNMTGNYELKYRNFFRYGVGELMWLQRMLLEE